MAELTLDRDEIELVIDSILATAGPGRYYLCGAATEPMARALVMRGIDARASEGLPSNLPTAGDGAIDVVVAWYALDHLDTAEVTAALTKLKGTALRSLVVRTDSSVRRSAVGGEKWLEPAALEAGFRKHPLYLQLSPYEGRENDGREDFLLFEAIPAGVMARYPQLPLGHQPIGPIDQLRNVGRRSDAHVERYRLALQWVRPGDTVLDVACGLGYGSATLFTGSRAARVIGVDESESAVRYAQDCYGVEGRVEFRRGDAQKLDFLPDASVDLVVSFETLEHLHEPGALLDEARRVLRPSGRIVCCVPNEWTDNTGEDPNPHHHHVYTWQRLTQELGERFRLEKGYRQVAGGGMKHTQGARLMREFAVDGEPGETEWLIAVAMRDPFDGTRENYIETTFPGYDTLPGFNVANFARDYDNPWMVKALVSIGFRFENRDGLLEMARRARRSAAAGSADEGAALCVEAYSLLESSSDGSADRVRMRAELAAYAERQSSKPHVLRWIISNLYVQGLLHLADGEFEAARDCFTRCAQIDPVPYSPLLATKTVGAGYLAGLLAALHGDEAAARQRWSHAIRSTHRMFQSDWTNVVGSEDRPLYFGLPEVELTVSKASKCAFALAALDDVRLRPGRFWVELSRDLESQAAREGRAGRLAFKALRSLDARGAVDPMEAVQLQTALTRQASTIAEMHRSFQQQADNISALQSELNRRDEALSKQARTIAEMHQSFAQQADNITHLNTRLVEADNALTRLQAGAGERAPDGTTLGALEEQTRTQRAALGAQAESMVRLQQQALESEARAKMLQVEAESLRAETEKAQAAQRRMADRFDATRSTLPFRLLRWWIDRGPK